VHIRPHLVPGWQRLLILVIPIVLGVGAVAGAYFYTSSTSGQAAAATTGLTNTNLEVPAPAGLLVHVIGAVAYPGIYRMKRGDRGYDAIAAAGGLTPAADSNRLPNLAGRLRDGEQIKVPFAKGTSGITSMTRANLNTATLEELAVVPGFTDALAQEVIDYRVNFGGFQSTRELVTELDMSEAEYVIARRYLTV